ncbi:uncharacterized protein LOC114735344 [Neltuma alba]|uniref:uncharacterized protein LOC114735344 n=1 Tax=Neltuma alba TaxID=207710 RepID=UPI0010A448F6|nr:uncharacterized protein LOC114735344 [Prosopis alba]
MEEKFWTISDPNSLLLRLRLLQESPLQPTPRLSIIQSSSGGGDAPHGSSFNVSGLDAKLRS